MLIVACGRDQLRTLDTGVIFDAIDNTHRVALAISACVVPSDGNEDASAGAKACVSMMIGWARDVCAENDAITGLCVVMAQELPGYLAAVVGKQLRLFGKRTYMFDHDEMKCVDF